MGGGRHVVQLFGYAKLFCLVGVGGYRALKYLLDPFDLVLLLFLFIYLLTWTMFLINTLSNG